MGADEKQSFESAFIGRLLGKRQPYESSKSISNALKVSEPIFFSTSQGGIGYWEESLSGGER